MPKLMPLFPSISLMSCRFYVNPAKEQTLLNAFTSTIHAAVVIQVMSIVIADLLLWVGEHGEGFAHLLELLLLLLLHLLSRRTVAVCKNNDIIQQRP